jgi:type VI secretion system VasD/TssJ family lipoprotein
MKTPLLLCCLALAGASCSIFSGVADYDLVFRGERLMNPNSEGDPNRVEVRIFRLAGEGAAKAFEQAEWSTLWEEPQKVPNMQLEADIVSRLLDPNDEPVTITCKRVDPKLTHFGVVCLFNSMPPKGSDRVLLPRDTAEAVEVWVHASRVETRQPGPLAPPSQGSRP